MIIIERKKVRNEEFQKIVLTIMLGVLVLLPSAVYAKTEVKTNEELKAATKMVEI